MNFRQYLEREFLKWQQQQGGRRTVNQFAEYLGVGQSTLSMWWNDERKPQGDNIRRLADKLGLEVYDVLGLKRPNAMLHYINKVWDTLPLKKATTMSQLKGISQNVMHSSVVITDQVYGRLVGEDVKHVIEGLG